MIFGLLTIGIICLGLLWIILERKEKNSLKKLNKIYELENNKDEPIADKEYQEEKLEEEV